jgi:hypothetical protein
MVRFEKLIWEQLVNTRALGRERVISTPRKWFNSFRHEENKVAAHYWYTTGLTGVFFKAFERPLSWLFWQWPRDIALQRGLSLEDFFLHQDREMRRDVLFEHIIRQSCHPYQHLLFKRRRARYYKVERAVRGFFVPDYVRKEAEQVTWADTAPIIDEWQQFTYLNFWSDMTPATRYTAMHRLIPLEIFNVYGLLREEAWERYFYNEVVYDGYTEADYKTAETPFGNFNLDREDGRRAFEEEVKKFISIYPGSIVRPGEEFNFQEFYAKYAIVNGKDTSKLDPKLVEELRVKLEEGTKSASSLSLPDDQVKKVGHSTLGTVFPKRLRSIHRRVMM